MFYSYKESGNPALLILLECCTINVWAADISWKVISLQLKGYTSMEWQFHVVQFLLYSQSHNLLSFHYIIIPWISCLQL
jgi:hypothetical protein